MTSDRLTETSKFLSFILRHEPEAIGIRLDSEGWVDLDALINAAAKNGRELDVALIKDVVQANEKRRFTLSEDGTRIRAAQGHSTSTVALKYAAATPPDVLYHGTATQFLDAIRREGLIPGKRHHVHLSQDETTALSTGARHGKPVVLVVQAMKMHMKGYRFFQADNGVWLVERVPSDFLD